MQTYKICSQIYVISGFDQISVRSTHQKCFVKKGVFGNFAKFTGKH